MGRQQSPIFNNNKLKLGLFSPNCSSGMAVTKVSERWDNSWENNIALAKLADEAGIEFLLPIARWIGYGGETDFHGSVLETVTWATGLLAHTSRINVFATVHTAFIHPFVAAKQLATADQLGRGRLGLNVVAGWNKPEYDAFGIDLPPAHTDRYALAQEWFDYVRAVWGHDGPFDWDGRFFKGKGIYAYPRPFDGPPPIMNAAGSTEGRDFAVRNADFLFCISIDLDQSTTEVAQIKAKAVEMGRSAGAFTLSHAVCRPTQREAEEYYRWYSETNADWAAVENLMTLQGLHAQSFPEEALRTMRGRFAAGHGTYPLVGDPDTIVNEMARITQAGFAGTTLSFVDYVQEFPLFRDEVIPRLERMGLRAPNRSS
ncbi:MAG: LLM class flavin-dependent oxidoreductase [Sphingomonadaceae bacterium]|nr:LLM class flavin-dependent oxidoreductase [Sphingomonadaceae bacterium]